MAKGDQIFIGVRNEGERSAANGFVSGVVTARQNGRSVTSKIEKESGINWLVVQETTRGGTIVEEIKVQLIDVVLIKTTRREV